MQEVDNETTRRELDDFKREAGAGLVKAHHLVPDVVRANLRSPTGGEAIREILMHFEGNPAVEDLQEWEEDLIRRERLHPTVTSQGIAFPHARTNAVREILWAVGVSKAGIPFHPDSPAVHLIVLIGVPERMIRQYLEFMGNLTKLLHFDRVIDMLVSAETDERLQACFSDLAIQVGTKGANCL